MAGSTLFKAGGISLACRGGGSGRPVVFLPGWGYGALMGEAALKPLRKSGIKLVTVDFPGTGDLKEESSFVHIPRLAAAMAVYMRENSLNEATVIGHSFGSMVAQEMAMTEDDVVGKLVLFSPLSGMGGMTADLQTSMDMLNRLLTGDKSLFSTLFTPGYLSQLKTMLGSVFTRLNTPQSAATLSGQVWAASRWSNLGRLGEIYQPTLIVQGEHDPLASPFTARTLAENINDARLITMKCGYLPFLENQEESLKLIKDFSG